jgi:hypothetical protein
MDVWIPGRLDIEESELPTKLAGLETAGEVELTFVIAGEKQQQVPVVIDSIDNTGPLTVKGYEDIPGKPRIILQLDTIHGGWLFDYE